MMIRRLTYFILLIFSVIDMAHAAKITAVLDSVTLLMGHKTTIHLEIVEPTNVEGELCLQPEQLIIPEIEVFGILYTKFFQAPVFVVFLCNKIEMI